MNKKLFEIKPLEGNGWCECMLLVDGYNIGEARYEKDYDNHYSTKERWLF